jgi:enterochelin esterase-like enzyme
MGTGTFAATPSSQRPRAETHMFPGPRRVIPPPRPALPCGTVPVGPEVHADRVVFRLADRGYASVQLQQELERPRTGPPLAHRDGVWELAYRRRQVDRMEYRFEADGESFCDPGNPRRAPGPFGERSVIEFPGYRPPTWLAAPDPEPSVPVADYARLWSPPGTDARRALPLLAVHDGAGYEGDGQLTRLIAHAVASGRLPPFRVALLDAPDREEAYSASARHARALAALLPSLAPATARAGMGASLGALAMLHAAWRHPSLFDGLYLQSGSYFRLRWDRHESGFPRFGRISRFVGTVLRAPPTDCPIPITLTCGAPEENLPNNRAVVAALRRQGHAVEFVVNRDAHNQTAWRDTFDPHLLALLERARAGPATKE